MNADDPSDPARRASPNPVADDNIQRLLAQAYHPEMPSPEFAQRVLARMLQASHQGAPPDDVPFSPVEIIDEPVEVQQLPALVILASWAAAIAAIVFICTLLPSRQPARTPEIAATSQNTDPDRVAVQMLGKNLQLADNGILVDQAQLHGAWSTLQPLEVERVSMPRPAAEVPTLPRAANGQSLETAANEQKLFSLADGSTLYMNESASVHVDSDHQINLHRGKVFLEVAPRDPVHDPRQVAFEVRTPDRTLTALGTKFGVSVDPQAKTSVVVTQGKVRVSGVDEPLTLGRRLAPVGPVVAGQKVPAQNVTTQVSAAPRASYLLHWTKDLMARAETPLVPPSQFAGGALLTTEKDGGVAKLSLRKLHVDVYIEDGFAHTTIDQTYFNPLPSSREGTFLFPLPADASLSRLATYIQGELTEASIVERKGGREAYEAAWMGNKDRALLEWVDGNTFKISLAPLAGRQEKRIVLSYTQHLTSAYGSYEYRFPAEHDVSGVTDWSCQARIVGGAQLTCKSTSHGLATAIEGHDLVLSGDERETPSRDLVLRIGEPQPTSAPDDGRFSSFEQDGWRYLMLRYRPQLPSHPQRLRRDWIVLFEASADRDPLLARTQIEIVRKVLENAEQDDTFSILVAGARTEPLFTQPQLATRLNIDAATAILGKVHLVGALDLQRALTAAQPLLQRAKNPCLLHVGGGLAVLGQRDAHKLVELLSTTTPYVGIGVGKRWSRDFMQLAAQRSNGYCTQINPDEQVGWRAFDLLATLSAPRMLGLSVTDADEQSPWLLMQNEVAQGEELCAIRRMKSDEQPPRELTVTGTLAGETVQRILPLKNVVDQAGYLPRAWARLEIDRLVAEDAHKHRRQIVELSQAMHVLSPFTSLLVLANQAQYAKKQVDRGPNDRWAHYDCPRSILVVTEPEDELHAVTELASVQQSAMTFESWQESDSWFDAVATHDSPESFYDRLNFVKRDDASDFAEKDLRFGSDSGTREFFRPKVADPADALESDWLALLYNAENASAGSDVALTDLSDAHLNFDFVSSAAGDTLAQDSNLAKFAIADRSPHLDDHGVDQTDQAYFYLATPTPIANNDARLYSPAQVRNTAAGPLSELTFSNGDMASATIETEHSSAVPDWAFRAVAGEQPVNPVARRALSGALNDGSKDEVSDATMPRLVLDPEQNRNLGWERLASPSDREQVALQYGIPTFNDQTNTQQPEVGFEVEWSKRSNSVAEQEPVLPLPVPPISLNSTLDGLDYAQPQLGTLHYSVTKNIAGDNTNSTTFDAFFNSRSTPEQPVLSPAVDLRAVDLRTGETLPMPNSSKLWLSTVMADNTTAADITAANVTSAGPRDASSPSMQGAFILTQNDVRRGHGDSTNKPSRWPAAIITAVRCLHARQFDRADAIIEPLLQDERYNTRSALWKLAEQIARERGMLATALARRERALDLEFRDEPQRLRLSYVRTQYSQLLAGYRQLALATAGLEQGPQFELQLKVMRAADRWRSLDPDPSFACRAAVQIFKILRADDLAWDYATTPLIAFRSDEAATPARSLAARLDAADYDRLADRAYEAAFEQQPDDPTILRDEAAMLERCGQTAAAQQVLRRIAEDKWDARYDDLKQRTKHQLGY